MAKQNNKKLPDYIQRMFTKAQYNIGDAVCFSWLGRRQYGIIVNIKTVSNEEISYTVSSYGTKYPCGIEVKEHRNRYHTAGFIQYNSGEDQDIISRRAAAANTELATNTSRTRVRKPNEDSVSGSDVRGNDSELPKNTKRSKPPTRKVAKQPSAKSTGRTRKTTSNTKLDTAIQKQRNFLNGFIKKD